MARTTGTPVWIELRTTDMTRTQDFYGNLFGWKFQGDCTEAAGYQMVTNSDGGWVGGGMDVTGMTCPQGKPLPSTWVVYLAVDDVEARARKAVEQGGTLVLPPGDAGRAGRFAVVLDPGGAAIGMWQAGEIEGFDTGDRPGTPVWFELMTQDFGRAVPFYREVFDFDIQPMTGQEYEGMTYATNGPTMGSTSGICDAREFIPAELGSFWRVYFDVPSCDPAVQQVRELGGQLLDGPQDSPFGRLATVADPVGANFQIGATAEATAPAPA